MTLVQDTNPYRFSTEWFPQFVQPLWEKFLLPRKESIRSYLEIGNWEGRSSLWMLQNVLTKPGDKMIGVDPYHPKRERFAGEYAEAEEALLANLQEYIADGRFEKVREWSQLWLRKQPMAGPDYAVKTFDVVYADGAHTGRQAMEDFVLSWPLVRKNGLLIIDDVNRRHVRGRANVHEAARAFEESFDGLFEWIYREPRQWMIQRRR